MVAKIHQFYQNFSLWIQHHPKWGLVVAFLIAFSESVPIIGTVIPGSATMTVIGLLVGVKLLPILATIASASLGAIAGDSIGLLLGHTLHHRLRNTWPFRSRPQLLDRGMEFIKNHGGKSIVIGRFIGIIRAIVPLIVGTLRMSIIKFYLIDIPSAILWAIVYMLPGYLIGRVALEIPPALETKIVTIIIMIGIGIFIINWLMSVINQRWQQISDILWQKMQYHYPWLCWILKKAPQRQKQVSGQLGLGITFMLLLVLLTIFCLIISQQTWFNHWELTSQHALQQLTKPITIKIATLITTFNSPTIILTITISVAFLLTNKGLLTTVCQLWLLILLNLITVWSINRFLVNTPLPSKSILLVVSVYGFISYLLAKTWSRQQKTIIWLTIIIYSLEILARLSLNLDSLTTITIAILLALCWLTLVILINRRHHHPPIHSWTLLLTSITTLLATNLFYHYHSH